MLLVPQPVIFPAQSLLGIGSPEGFVDTRAEMPAGGRVYIAFNEANEIARLFGFRHPDDARKDAGRIRDLERQLAEAEGELAELRPVRDAITAASSR